MAPTMVTRRAFVTLCGVSAASLGLSHTPWGVDWVPSPAVRRAFAQAADGKPPVIWLQGASCTGCSVSLLNSTHPSVADVLLNIISLRYHPTVMAAAGDLATSAMEDVERNAAGEFILIVEGSVPTAAGGAYCIVGEHNGRPETMLERTKRLGAAAKAVVALGTCAAYGGIPAAAPNPSGAKRVSEIIGKPTINIAGCPPHPDWIVGSLAHVLLFGMPELDDAGRPKLFYDHVIHENCQLYQYFQKEKFAENPGDEGCLVFLGCKGPVAHSDCYERHWNNGVNWCIGSGAPCIGCTQPDFPDGMSPFYAKLPDEKLDKAIERRRATITRGVVPPYVIGLPEDEAIRLLQQAGLGLSGTVNYQGDEELPNHVRTQVKVGCVLSTTPAAGSRIGEGGTVAVAVRKN